MDDIVSQIDRRNLWIVSPARNGRFAIDRPGACRELVTGRQYHISSIGRYLLSPRPLNIIKRLVGCEIHKKQFRLTRGIKNLHQRFTGKASIEPPPATLQLDLRLTAEHTATADLNRHIHSIYEKLRPLDIFFQAVEHISPQRIAKVVGICEDDAGYRSPLLIDGDASRQLEYIKRHVGREVSVRLKRAYVADGLFEMKGFNFPDFNPNTFYRLIRFNQSGAPKACVLEKDNGVSFWLDDTSLIKYLELLEYCIHENRQMYESFCNCIKGKAIPIRIMFNKKISIDYTRAPLPNIFHSVSSDSLAGDQTRQLIRQNLNNHQIGVSFNSLAQHKTGASELCTDIAILQNLRALEPIKDSIPVIFEEMGKRAANSEGEKFYLLETIRGVNHES